MPTTCETALFYVVSHSCMNEADLYTRRKCCDKVKAHQFRDSAWQPFCSSLLCDLICSLSRLRVKKIKWKTGKCKHKCLFCQRANIHLFCVNLYSFFFSHIVLEDGGSPWFSQHIHIIYITLYASNQRLALEEHRTT